ncbi:PDZ and LIM domain protein 2-like [Pomacea canaliculata]|uniref:PDZ and LIM domain protein 2-like n=1 Tax=Pomacea canaliculata TaxID=400727 RepID=UPI000D72AA4F|nr:PDZ and LIM domain protein 2-like [Pomacea canaliculata]
MDYSDCVYVCLRRDNSSQPWGFRLMGGYDQGQYLYVAKVNPRSLAEKFHLRPGDGVMRIGQVPALYLNHDQAKAEILRAGNELELMLRRGAVPEAMTSPGFEPKANTRAVVEEEPTQYRGRRNPTTQSRCFRILTDALVEDINEN